MKNKSLVLALGLVGLCQVQFLKAPESIFFKPENFDPAPRGRDDNNLPRDRGNELLDALKNRGKKPAQNTGTMGADKPNHVAGRAPSNDGPPEIIVFEGKTGPGMLDAKEEEILLKIAKERPSFAQDEDKHNDDDVSKASSRLADLKDTKIKLIENFRSELKEQGLPFDVLKQCEGLKNYKIIQKEIEEFYKKVTAKGDVDPKIEDEMEKALEKIKSQQLELASQLFTREANKLIRNKDYNDVTNSRAFETALKRAHRGEFTDADGNNMDPFVWVFKKINGYRKDGEDAKAAAKLKKETAKARANKK